MKRISVALALVAAVSAGSGCSLISRVKTKIRVCHAANDAWYCFTERNECLDHPEDIRNGFKRGYKAFVYTNHPGPSPLLPSKYYRAWYQTCFGRHQIDAWREGWEFGQYVASQDCLGRGHCNRCGSGGCAGNCGPGCPTGVPMVPGDPGCPCGAPGAPHAPSTPPGGPFPGGAPYLQPESQWHPAQGEMMPVESYDGVSYGTEGVLQPPAQLQQALPSPPPPSASMPQMMMLQQAMPGQTMPVQTMPVQTMVQTMPPQTMPAPAQLAAPQTVPATPSARLELPAPTDTDVSPADAARDPPQTEVPARNTSLPGAAPLRAPLNGPQGLPMEASRFTPPRSAETDSSRGPELMTPTETPPMSAAPGPATLEAPLSRLGIPPAAAPETDASQAAPTFEKAPADFGNESPGRVAVSNDPFAEPVQRAAAPEAAATPPAQPLPANKGWKPLDWKPTKTRFPPR